MKRALIVLGHGLTGILSGIAKWFTVILGMKDDSKYGRFLRRVVGTCFALIMLFFAFLALAALYKRISDIFRNMDDGDYYEEYLSRNATYHVSLSGKEGYVENENGKKTIKGISWIAKPLGLDSLVCYSNGRKRGYFNIYTGEIAIEPQYAHAWIFSEGLAAVDDRGWIKFIDGTGKVVIDLKMPYIPGIEGYVFHNQHCAVHDDRRDRFGLIDKQGKWALNAEYFSIEPCDTFWVIDNGKKKSVITDNMQTVIPFIAKKIEINEKTITVTMEDHTVRIFTLQGSLIDDFCIRDIEVMSYDTDKLHSAGLPGNEYDGMEGVPISAIARCKRYEAESGWYGLMTWEGKVLTPPSYSSIEAVGVDLYFCKGEDDCGILLNGKGEKIDGNKF